MPTKGQSKTVDRMKVSGIENAISYPVKLVFIITEIDIIAIKDFIEKRSAAKKYFEVFKLPLGDINEHKIRMS